MSPRNKRTAADSGKRTAAGSGKLGAGSGKLGADSSSGSIGESDDQDYRVRRDRNNVAVKKSREKSKVKTQSTLERVNRLKLENEELELKATVLAKELSLLKDIFLSHTTMVSEGTMSCHATGTNVNKEALEKDHQYHATLLD